MPESDILYAELLLNIRQISVIASLKSPITKETTLKLSEDGQSVILTHNGNTQKLNLPASVAASPQLLRHQSAKIGGKEISWRLPLRDQSPQKKDEDFSQAAIAPWAATNLPESTSLLCRKCQAMLVESGVISTWKDLPSENWAEMMDFWHCHKPTDDEDRKPAHGHDEDDASHQKGYGANTKFLAESGVGFVGLTYFLLSEKDCRNIERSGSYFHNESSFTCKNCANPIGTTDFHAEGIRLHKWSLSIPSAPNYPLSNFITSHIASLINSQAVSKFFIHSPPPPSSPSFHIPKPKTTALHAWVFTPKMTYSISSAEKGISKGPQVGMKIFCKAVVDEERKEKLLDDEAVEAISLPREVLSELLQVLGESNALLPRSVRRFQDWDVAVLDRYDGGK